MSRSAVTLAGFLSQEFVAPVCATAGSTAQDDVRSLVIMWRATIEVSSFARRFSKIMRR